MRDIMRLISVLITVFLSLGAAAPLLDPVLSPILGGGGGNAATTTTPAAAASATTSPIVTTTAATTTSSPAALPTTSIITTSAALTTSTANVLTTTTISTLSSTAARATTTAAITTSISSQVITTTAISSTIQTTSSAAAAIVSSSPNVVTTSTLIATTATSTTPVSTSSAVIATSSVTKVLASSSIAGTTSTVITTPAPITTSSASATTSISTSTTNQVVAGPSTSVAAAVSTSIAAAVSTTLSTGVSTTLAAAGSTSLAAAVTTTLSTGVSTTLAAAGSTSLAAAVSTSIVAAAVASTTALSTGISTSLAVGLSTSVVAGTSTPVAASVSTSVANGLTTSVAAAVGASLAAGVSASVAVGVSTSVAVGVSTSVAVGVSTSAAAGLTTSVATAAVTTTLSTGVSTTAIVGVSTSIADGITTSVAAVVTTSIGAGVSTSVAAAVSNPVAVGVSTLGAVGVSTSILTAAGTTTLSSGSVTTQTAVVSTSQAAGDSISVAAGITTSVAAAVSATVTVGVSASVAAGASISVAAGIASSVAAGTSTNLAAGGIAPVAVGVSTSVSPDVTTIVMTGTTTTVGAGSTTIAAASSITTLPAGASTTVAAVLATTVVPGLSTILATGASTTIAIGVSTILTSSVSASIAVGLSTSVAVGPITVSTGINSALASESSTSIAVGLVTTTPVGVSTSLATGLSNSSSAGLSTSRPAGASTIIAAEVSTSLFVGVATSTLAGLSTSVLADVSTTLAPAAIATTPVASLAIAVATGSTTFGLADVTTIKASVTTTVVANAGTTVIATLSTTLAAVGIVMSPVDSLSSSVALGVTTLVAAVPTTVPAGVSTTVAVGASTSIAVGPLTITAISTPIVVTGGSTTIASGLSTTVAASDLAAVGLSTSVVAVPSSSVVLIAPIAAATSLTLGASISTSLRVDVANSIAIGMSTTILAGSSSATTTKIYETTAAVASLDLGTVFITTSTAPVVASIAVIQVYDSSAGSTSTTSPLAMPTSLSHSVAVAVSASISAALSPPVDMGAVVGISTPIPSAIVPTTSASINPEISAAGAFTATLSAGLSVSQTAHVEAPTTSIATITSAALAVVASTDLLFSVPSAPIGLSSVSTLTLPTGVSTTISLATFTSLSTEIPLNAGYDISASIAAGLSASISAAVSASVAASMSATNDPRSLITPMAGLSISAAADSFITLSTLDTRISTQSAIVAINGDSSKVADVTAATGFLTKNRMSATMPTDATQIQETALLPSTAVLSPVPIAGASPSAAMGESASIGASVAANVTLAASVTNQLVPSMSIVASDGGFTVIDINSISTNLDISTSIANVAYPTSMSNILMSSIQLGSTEFTGLAASSAVVHDSVTYTIITTVSSSAISTGTGSNSNGLAAGLAGPSTTLELDANVSAGLSASAAAEASIGQITTGAVLLADSSATLSLSPAAETGFISIAQPTTTILQEVSSTSNAGGLTNTVTQAASIVPPVLANEIASELMASSSISAIDIASLAPGSSTSLSVEVPASVALEYSETMSIRASTSVHTAFSTAVLAEFATAQSVLPTISSLTRLSVSVASPVVTTALATDIANISTSDLVHIGSRTSNTLVALEVSTTIAASASASLEVNASASLEVNASNATSIGPEATVPDPTVLLPSASPTLMVSTFAVLSAGFSDLSNDLSSLRSTIPPELSLSSIVPATISLSIGVSSVLPGPTSLSEADTTAIDASIQAGLDSFETMSFSVLDMAARSTAISEVLVAQSSRDTQEFLSDAPAITSYVSAFPSMPSASLSVIDESITSLVDSFPDAAMQTSAITEAVRNLTAGIPTATVAVGVGLDATIAATVSATIDAPSEASINLLTTTLASSASIPIESLQATTTIASATPTMLLVPLLPSERAIDTSSLGEDVLEPTATASEFVTMVPSIFISFFGPSSTVVSLGQDRITETSIAVESMSISVDVLPPSSGISTDLASMTIPSMEGFLSEPLTIPAATQGSEALATNVGSVFASEPIDVSTGLTITAPSSYASAVSAVPKVSVTATVTATIGADVLSQAQIGATIDPNLCLDAFGQVDVNIGGCDYMSAAANSMTSATFESSTLATAGFPLVPAPSESISLTKVLESLSPSVSGFSPTEVVSSDSIVVRAGSTLAISNSISIPLDNAVATIADNVEHQTQSLDVRTSILPLLSTETTVTVASPSPIVIPIPTSTMATDNDSVGLLITSSAAVESSESVMPSLEAAYVTVISSIFDVISSDDVTLRSDGLSRTSAVPGIPTSIDSLASLDLTDMPRFTSDVGTVMIPEAQPTSMAMAISAITLLAAAESSSTTLIEEGDLPVSIPFDWTLARSISSLSWSAHSDYDVAVDNMFVPTSAVFLPTANSFSLTSTSLALMASATAEVGLEIQVCVDVYDIAGVYVGNCTSTGSSSMQGSTGSQTASGVALPDWSNSATGINPFPTAESPVPSVAMPINLAQATSAALISSASMPTLESLTQALHDSSTPTPTAQAQSQLSAGTIDCVSIFGNPQVNAGQCSSGVEGTQSPAFGSMTYALPTWNDLSASGPATSLQDDGVTLAQVILPTQTLSAAPISGLASMPASIIQSESSLLNPTAEASHSFQEVSLDSTLPIPTLAISTSVIVLPETSSNYDSVPEIVLETDALLVTKTSERSNFPGPTSLVLADFSDVLGSGTMDTIDHDKTVIESSLPVLSTTFVTLSRPSSMPMPILPSLSESHGVSTTDDMNLVLVTSIPFLSLSQNPQELPLSLEVAVSATSLAPTMTGVSTIFEILPTAVTISTAPIEISGPESVTTVLEASALVQTEMSDLASIAIPTWVSIVNEGVTESNQASATMAGSFLPAYIISEPTGVLPPLPIVTIMLKTLSAQDILSTMPSVIPVSMTTESVLLAATETISSPTQITNVALIPSVSIFLSSTSSAAAQDFPLTESASVSNLGPTIFNDPSPISLSSPADETIIDQSTIVWVVPTSTPFSTGETTIPTTDLELVSSVELSAVSQDNASASTTVDLAPPVQFDLASTAYDNIVSTLSGGERLTVATASLDLFIGSPTIIADLFTTLPTITPPPSSYIPTIPTTTWLPNSPSMSSPPSFLEADLSSPTLPRLSSPWVSVLESQLSLDSASETITMVSQAVQSISLSSAVLPAWSSLAPGQNDDATFFDSFTDSRSTLSGTIFVTVPFPTSMPVEQTSSALDRLASAEYLGSLPTDSLTVSLDESATLHSLPSLPPLPPLPSAIVDNMAATSPYSHADAGSPSPVPLSVSFSAIGISSSLVNPVATVPISEIAEMASSSPIIETVVLVSTAVLTSAEPTPILSTSESQYLRNIAQAMPILSSSAILPHFTSALVFAPSASTIATTVLPNLSSSVSSPSPPSYDATPSIPITISEIESSILSIDMSPTSLSLPQNPTSSGTESNPDSIYRVSSLATQTPYSEVWYASVTPSPLSSETAAETNVAVSIPLDATSGILSRSIDDSATSPIAKIVSTDTTASIIDLTVPTAVNKAVTASIPVTQESISTGSPTILTRTSDLADVTQVITSSEAQFIFTRTADPSSITESSSQSTPVMLTSLATMDSMPTLTVSISPSTSLQTMASSSTESSQLSVPDTSSSSGLSSSQAAQPSTFSTHLGISSVLLSSAALSIPTSATSASLLESNVISLPASLPISSTENAPLSSTSMATTTRAQISAFPATRLVASVSRSLDSGVLSQVSSFLWSSSRTSLLTVSTTVPAQGGNDVLHAIGHSRQGTRSRRRTRATLSSTVIANSNNLLPSGAGALTTTTLDHIAAASPGLIIESSGPAARSEEFIPLVMSTTLPSSQRTIGPLISITPSAVITRSDSSASSASLTSEQSTLREIDHQDTSRPFSPTSSSGRHANIGTSTSPNNAAGQSPTVSIDPTANIKNIQALVTKSTASVAPSSTALATGSSVGSTVYAADNIHGAPVVTTNDRTSDTTRGEFSDSEVIESADEGDQIEPGTKSAAPVGNAQQAVADTVSSNSTTFIAADSDQTPSIAASNDPDQDTMHGSSDSHSSDAADSNDNNVQSLVGTAAYTAQAAQSTAAVQTSAIFDGSNRFGTADPDLVATQTASSVRSVADATETRFARSSELRTLTVVAPTSISGSSTRSTGPPVISVRPDTLPRGSAVSHTIPRLLLGLCTGVALSIIF